MRHDDHLDEILSTQKDVDRILTDTKLLPGCWKTPWTGKFGFSESKSPLRSPSLCVTFLRPSCGSAAGWHAEPSFSTAWYTTRWIPKSAKREH